MGVDPDNNWAASYEVLPGKEKVVADLKKLAHNANAVYLATDRDREGEAIAWHLKQLIGGTPKRFRRVVFKRNYQKAPFRKRLSTPAKIDENRGQRATGAALSRPCRRFRAVAPVVGQGGARPVGRSGAIGCGTAHCGARTGRFRAFVPEEYWEVFAELAKGADEPGYRFQVIKENGTDFRPGTSEQAEAAAARLAGPGFFHHQP